jgi:hypothetical protein
VVQVLVPALLDLEAHLFDEMLKLLWWGVLLHTGEVAFQLVLHSVDCGTF